MVVRENNLFKSAGLLNSLLIFVVVFFMIDAVYARCVYLKLYWIGLIFAIPVKFYCYGGIYGYLTEIASGQETVIGFSRFHQNALRYAWLWAGIIFVLYGFNFVLYFFLPLFRSISVFQYFYPLVSLPVSLGLAYGILWDKYLKQSKMAQRPILISKNGLGVILILFAMGCFLSWMPLFLSVNGFDWHRVTRLGLHYLFILQYIYFLYVFLDVYPEIAKSYDPADEIFLINPCAGGVFDGIAYRFQAGYPPVFVVLKALTPKKYSFKEFNRIFWRERYYKRNKLVAITCYTSNCAEAYKIAKEFKKRGSRVVMGGPHVTYLPDEALAFCDSVVIGEAEGVWKQVIEDYESQTLKPKYMGTAVDDYYKEVHQELLISPPHVIRDFLETTRGCKFRCHFCTIPSLSGGITRKKPVSEIVELIQKIKHKYRDIIFLDNNIYSDPAYAKELFQALIPLNIKWHTQCTIDIAKNAETLELAKKSGCAEFLFGYEIFGGSLEKQQGGKFAMAQNYLKYTKTIKEKGIKIKTHFIFGFDSDGFNNLFTLWNFCFRIWPQWTVISMLSPLPGSRVYHDMLDENRIINLNWRNYATNHLLFKHPHLNNKIASWFFPYIRNFFMLTTSSGGVMILLIIIIMLYLELILKPKLFFLF